MRYRLWSWYYSKCHTGITGLWTLHSGRLTLNTRHWTLHSGDWNLDARPWTLDYGLWTLDSRLWTLDDGLWYWTLDCGRDYSQINSGTRGEHLTSQLSWLPAWLLVTNVCLVYLLDELILVFHASLWLG